MVKLELSFGFVLELVLCVPSMRKFNFSFTIQVNWGYSISLFGDDESVQRISLLAKLFVPYFG